MQALEWSVGIVGCGQMGTGIAHVALEAGYPCVVCEADAKRLEIGLKSVHDSLRRAFEKGRLAAEVVSKSSSLLTGCSSLEEMARCDIVIEAVPEDASVKGLVFEALNRNLKPEALIATNTSSLSVTGLMSRSGRPAQFLGLHFFNPVPLMRLVEVIVTSETSDATTEACLRFVESLGKTAVRCQDRTGFVVNRLLIPYLLDAVRALEAGTSSMEEIDKAMKLGCGHPMGPFALMDLIGLDTVVSIAEILFDEYRESRMAPPPLLRRMIYSGRLGRKTGSGFYEYKEKVR